MPPILKGNFPVNAYEGDNFMILVTLQCSADIVHSLPELRIDLLLLNEIILDYGAVA